MMSDNDGAKIFTMFFLLLLCFAILLFAVFGIAQAVTRTDRFASLGSYEIVPGDIVPVIENGVETITIRLQRFVGGE